MQFEANRGQTSAQAQFLTRSRGSVVFLTAHGMVVKTLHGAVSMDFAGSSAARARGQQPQSSRVHYLVGRTDLTVPTYGSVRYAGMYSGVDVLYYGHQGQVEFDLDLAPHAATSHVALLFSGAVPRLQADGSLSLGGGISLLAPRAWQTTNGQRRSVPVRYQLHPDHRVTLQLGSYDTSRPLVIDPVLLFASLLGGTAFNQANAVALDSSGNIYVTGYTLSPDFPVASSYQANLAPGTFGPDFDAFVTEMAAGGATLVYSTYLGGNGDDEATGIAVNPSTGAAYVTGFTSSTNFPTHSPLQSANAGGYDAFVTALNPGGATLAYSTYIGGSEDDRANGIALDGSGDAFIVGTTDSTDFPTSSGAPQAALAGKTNAFVVALNPSGGTELYSTYLGGSGTDRGLAIAVDQTGNAYIGGSTTSANFPVTSGAYQASAGRGSDGFVAQFLRSGTLGYASYFGGTGADEVNAVTVDTARNLYIAGDTTSSNLFCPAGACGTSYGGNGDAFAAKLNNQGSSMTWGMYLSASPGGVATSIGVDASDDVYVAGYTGSNTLPATSNALQQSSGGDQDGFLVKLDPSGPTTSGSPYLFYSYLGGSSNDAIQGLAMQSNGDLAVVGFTSSSNFPVTTGAYQTTSNSATDAFVAEFIPAAQGVFSPPELGFAAQAPTVASTATSVTFSNGGELPLVITSISTTGPYTETDDCSANSSTLQPTQSCTLNVVFTPTASGTQAGQLIIKDNSPSGSEVLPLTGSGGSFSLTVAPTSFTISAGSTASFSLDVAPATGYTQVVTLSCAGIGSAQNATCAASPASLTMNGVSAQIATVTVTTTVRPSILPWLPEPPPGPWRWLAITGILLALAGTLYGLRLRGTRRRLGWVGTALLIGLSLVAAGCGGSTTNPGTPAGNYPLTFTGTAGSTTQTVTVKLAVN